jgi:outer membrane protein assembly factor BamE (lipoprotein component of BamABCDE complex)
MTIRPARRLRWLLLASVVALAACAPRIDQRGNLLDPDAVLAVKPGEQTKEQVAQLLGTPSTVATFNDKIWYYVSKRTSTTAFFEPSITDQQVVVIKFNDSNVVENVQLLGMDDAYDHADLRPAAHDPATAVRQHRPLHQGRDQAHVLTAHEARKTPRRHRPRGVSRCGRPRPGQAARIASSRSATMLVILIIGFTAGPAVSL